MHSYFAKENIITLLFLLDVTGILDTSRPKAVYMPEDNNKSYLKFKITDGRYDYFDLP